MSSTNCIELHRIEPILVYGCAIWGLTEYGTMDTVQNEAVRFFLGVRILLIQPLGKIVCYVISLD